MDNDNQLIHKFPAILLEVFNAKQNETNVELVSIQSEKTPVKITRTAMGDYIVETGEKPLTALGIAGPGPADYSPVITATRSEAPRYSVAGKSKNPKPKETPGPSNYYTGGDMKWKDKTISQKGRRTTSVFDDEAAKSASDIGPARYRVQVREFGKTGPKYSIAHRNIDSGIKSRLIQPTDVHGFETPGPNYRPNSAYWGRGPKKSFGNSRKTGIDGNPGPADYEVREPMKGAAYSLAKRIPNRNMLVAVKAGIPSPNTYDLGTTIGKAVAMSMTARREDLQAHRCGPSPNSYQLKSTLAEKGNAKSMAYKRFDRNVEYQPGPGDYEIKPQVIQPRNPAFSCRKRTIMTYPDTKSNTDTENSPGPASYPLINDFRKNDRPAYSIGSRSKPWQDNDGPGPNKYNSEKYPKPGTEKAPAFSMRKRIERPDIGKNVPGPAAYHPNLPNIGPSYTITKRSKPLKVFTNPAANAYTPPSQQTIRGLPTKIGISLKSRASPWIYSGYKTNKLSDPTI